MKGPDLESVYELDRHAFLIVSSSPVKHGPKIVRVFYLSFSIGSGAQLEVELAKQIRRDE
jgi:hypothetical protein